MHTEELKEASAYHQGYEDDLAVRAADEWALEMERGEIARKLQELEFSPDGDSAARLAAIAKCILKPRFGWTMGACEQVRDQLVRLLGGDECNFSAPENDVRADDADMRPAETFDADDGKSMPACKVMHTDDGIVGNATCGVCGRKVEPSHIYCPWCGAWFEEGNDG